MKLMEMAQEELRQLGPREVALVYELIQGLKEKSSKHQTHNASEYLEIRKLLWNPRGKPMSQIVIEDREDRV